MQAAGGRRSIDSSTRFCRYALAQPTWVSLKRALGFFLPFFSFLHLLTTEREEREVKEEEEEVRASKPTSICYLIWSGVAGWSTHGLAGVLTLSPSIRIAQEEDWKRKRKRKQRSKRERERARSIHTVKQGRRKKRPRLLLSIYWTKQKERERDVCFFQRKKNNFFIFFVLSPWREREERREKERTAFCYSFSSTKGTV